MRFETAVPIGRGATGEILKAWDPELERWVALKLLRRDDPESEARMLQEARAQARVVHPNVCRVYDTGRTEEGRPYIAMQLVEGRPLDVVAAGRPVEERVELLRRVALAVQAAHEVGLVHRDLKPGNVLVEERADGALEPFVLDFGIAREPSVAGLTVTGQVLGTPGYLSPEQARGESRTLDRRSDVFGLGVLLHELLGGAPPFAAESALASLIKVLEEDPPPLPGVAPELRAVVERCLEKSPERRYPTAAALADDLGRWLRGEPVEARRVGALVRLGRRARRRPAAAAAISVAVVAVVGALAQTALERGEAHRRQVAAQRFGQETERIEAVLRREHALPLHDVRPAHAEVRRRLERIEAELGALPAAARGPALLALGRGRLALGDAEVARRHLELAWRDGYRPPEVAWALGSALGELYREGLERASRIGAPERREAERARLAAELRDPARELLAQAGGTAEGDAELIAGQIALVEGSWSAAAEHGRAAFRAAPWRAEAAALAGRALAVAGVEQLRRGEMDAARASLAAAGEENARALDIARSDPALHEAECVRLGRVLLFDLMTGTPEAALHERAGAACRAGLLADADRSGLWTALATVEWRWGEHLLLAGGDPAPVLAEAARAAARAVELEPASERALRELATVWELTADADRRHGRDPEPALERAIAANRRVLEINPNSDLALSSLASAHWTSAEHVEGGGGDPAPLLEQAAELLARAGALNPIYSHPMNEAHVLRELARVRGARGGEAGAVLDRALAAAEAATERNAEFFRTWMELAAVRAERARAHPPGSAPRAAELDAGRRAAARALAAKPGDVEALAVADELGRL